MYCELNGLMYEAWKRIEGRVLGDERELRRRLERRGRIFDSVPRPFCLAIRASDRRLTEVNAWMSPHGAMDKGAEMEHEVFVTSRLMEQLCWPREVLHGEAITEIARDLGCSFERARAMERRGVMRMKGISLLMGRRGHPVPVSVGGTLLDPCAKGKRAPHEILWPIWEDLVYRLPGDVEQLIWRKPVFVTIRGRYRFLRWLWVCPACKREVRTIYFPMGSPDWAAAYKIKLPGDGWYEESQRPGVLACGKCHKVANVSFTAGRIASTWGELVRHMSGGLLYGREVERPAAFGVMRRHKPFRVRRKAPRRDEFEGYLVDTDLSMVEIARRMGWKYKSARRVALGIYRLRGVAGREELRRWRRERAGEGGVVVAA